MKMYQKKAADCAAINSNRLSTALNSLSEIGRNSQGGIDRAFGSLADRMARKWLESYWNNELHLSARIDPAANMWIQLDGMEQLPPIYMGSHIDTVPNGGSLDGALGVLLASELIHTVQENKIPMRHPIGVVSFTGEEPNPFQVSTLGSKVLSGRLTVEQLKQMKNEQTGESLESAMAKVGGNINLAEEAQLIPGQISAFMECHIEQGRRLFNKGLSVATVTRITGIYREIITVTGEANHAGTTAPRDRKDALLAASELNLALEKIIKDINIDEAVATIGYISASPNAANIIPGTVKMTVDLRTCQSDLKKAIIQQFGKAAEEISKKRGVVIEREINLDQPYSDMSELVMNALNRGAETIGEPVTTFASMAGHDSANMGRVTNAGMLFVQSINGRSHCPEEHTCAFDIEKAGNTMLNALLTLDKELD